MISRYVRVILFLVIAGTANAQQSMLQNVDNAYLDKLIATAKANYPKVRENEIKVHLAQQAIKKAKLDWFNIISFTYLYSPNNTFSYVNPSLLNGYQIGFSTSIGNIVERPAEVRAARENYKMSMLAQDEYNLNQVATIKRLYYAYVQLQTVLDWRTKSLEGATATVKEVKYKFEKGVESFDNYNRSETFLSTTIQQKIEAEGALLMAKSNLEEMLGTNLESIK